jgi:ribosome-associated toxin RatA of RatAB toxin-antitoxin module
MKRTQATDCLTLPFDVAVLVAAVLDCERYHRWWPAQLRVQILRVTPDRVGSQIEIQPRGGRFVCEIARVAPDREIEIEYVEGVHRGKGRWTFERLGDGTRACYQIDLAPQGWLPRLLSNWMDVGDMHSRSMAKVFDGMGEWLRARNASRTGPNS